MHRLAWLGMLACSTGCLYLEGGGGLYSGPGATLKPGYAVSAGFYVDLGQGKVASGGGAADFKADGVEHLSGGGETSLTGPKLVDRALGDQEAGGGAFLVRPTVALHYPTRDSTPTQLTGWGALFGASFDLGLDPVYHGARYNAFSGQHLYLNVGVGVMHDRSGTYAGPEARAGIASNISGWFQI